MRFTMDREFYLPREANGCVNIQTIQDADAIVYTYETKTGQLGARGFHGKQAKPDWHYSFRTAEQRSKHIAEYFDSRKQRASYMAERKDRLRNDPGSIQNRNRQIKTILEHAFGRGKVSVTGSRGTAYGWVTVKIDCVARDWQHERELFGQVMELLRKANIRLGTYYSDDGSNTAHAEIHISFNRAPAPLANLKDVAW